jgi:hypothetical protein
VLLLGLGCLLVSLVQAGCSRAFWRNQADRDSYLAISERLNDPRWALARYNVTPDPNSRFYDPYDPDCEPLPPDDTAAHAYMHWADGWTGFKGWHKFGDLVSLENPQWLANFGWSTDNIDPLTGEIVPPVPELQGMTLGQAVELAQIHSREYQYQIENVYLAALAVTFQRFQFGVRYLGTNGVEPTAGSTTTFVPHGVGDSAMGVAGGVSQLLPAGTQWAVEFANNTLWLFSGGNQTNSLSTLSFSIIQPLLFGAGRKVGLEGLTQAERNLLYDARWLARFRQQIFTTVVGGTDGSNYGLSGAPSPPGNIGFLQLLQQLQIIRNQQYNISQLEEQVERLLAQSSQNELFAGVDLEKWPLGEFTVEALPAPLRGKLTFYPATSRLRWASSQPISSEEINLLRNLSDDPAFQQAVGNIITSLQTRVATQDVLQLQSTLASSVISLRNLQLDYQNNLDVYKLLLGLRTDFKLSIDDTLLKQFEIIDPQLQELETATKEFIDVWGVLDEEQLNREELRQAYVQFLALIDRVKTQGIDLVIKDLARVRQAVPQRLQDLDSQDQEQFHVALARSADLLDEAGVRLQTMRSDVVENAQGLRVEVEPRLRRTTYEALGKLREDLLRLTRNLMVIQLSLRIELIELPSFEMAMETAVRVALENRVDLMNERALVMDARRKVEIAANALLAGLDVVIDGDINTPGGNRPFDFRGSQSQIRAGVAFTAPLDQIDERNFYRTSLINYQRQRRNFMQIEDQVKQEVRNAWRELVTARQNMETSRRATRISALQYDSAVELSNAPVTPGASTKGNGVAGNNLQKGLQSLLNAQNSLIRTWITYEVNRLNIYRDMGIMEIGPDGIWADPFYQDQVNDVEDDALGPNLNLGDPPPSNGTGSVRLGTGPADRNLDTSDGSGLIQVRAQKPGAGDSPARPLPGEPQRPGISRQP